MKPKVELVVALVWLSIAACACTGTAWAVRELGGSWKLYTGLGLFAGLCMLIIAGRCFTWGGWDDKAGG